MNANLFANGHIYGLAVDPNEATSIGLLAPPSARALSVDPLGLTYMHEHKRACTILQLEPYGTTKTTSCSYCMDGIHIAIPNKKRVQRTSTNTII